MKNEFNPNQFSNERGEYSDFISSDPIRNDYHYYSVSEELGEVKGKNILDVGAGDGLFAQMLALRGASVTGFDKAEKSIAIANERTSKSSLAMRFQVATPETFVANGEFDEAISIMVLPYAENENNLKDFFSSTYRALKAGGRFISIIFNPEFHDFGKTIGNRRFVRLEEGKVRVEFLNPKTGEVSMVAQLTQFPKEVFEKSIKASGFTKTQWKNVVPDPKSIESRGAQFWQQLEDSPPYAELIATK